MGIVTLIHTQLAQTIWMFFLAMGLWGVVRSVRGMGVGPSYLGAMVIGQLLFVIQAILGVILWLNGSMVAVERPFMHVLYGSFALVFLPFVFLAWLKGDDSNRGMWVLTFTVLFVFGVALRNMGVI
jgi:hypothetical protein